MRKIQILFTFLIGYITYAQSISPSQYLEYCPGQQYTFTATLPGNATGTVSSEGSGYGYSISTNGTSITFYFTFADNNRDQKIILNYYNQDGSISSSNFIFANVKSLFGGTRDNNLTSVDVPICNTTPFTLNLNAAYLHSNNFTTNGFGLIIKFAYRIPSGWLINGQLSNGGNTFIFTGPVTITPNATTGGVIWYQAMSDCDQATFQGEGAFRSISINRGTPTFSISPSSLQFTCGTTKTQTFTVTQTGTTSCGVSYVWNLGANNGWLYNGSPAPATISTTGTSITLTSANGNVLPSSVSVTPYLGGNPLSSISCTTSFTAFSTTATVSGLPAVCLGTTGTYTVTGLPAGVTVTGWSSSNTAAGTINGSGVVTAVANGSTTIRATLTNACGQTTTLTKDIGIGAPSLPNGTLYGNLWVRKFFGPMTLGLPTIIGATNYVWTIENDPDFSNNCTASTRAKFTANNSTTSYTSTVPSATISFGSCLAYYIVRCTVSNNCGSAVLYERYVTVGNSGSSPCNNNNGGGVISSLKNNNLFTLENPIKEKSLRFKMVDQEITQEVTQEITLEELPTSNIINGDNPCSQDWPMEYEGKVSVQNVKEIAKESIFVTVYDLFGRQVLSKTIDGGIEEFSIEDATLTSGKYIVNINQGNQSQKQIVIVE